MHRPIPSPPQLSVGRRGSHGQSLVEFALVLPVVLILFLAVADFGRVFAASIAVEAATRDAAEATANQYLADPPGPLDSPAPAPSVPDTYYGSLHGLHAYGAGVVCAELRSQLNTNYDQSTQTCPDMPVVFVCVHDGADPSCDSEASPGSSGVPAGCTALATTPTNAQSLDQPSARWVEVRTCYHFTPLLNLPIFSLGDFWLQRTRDFTIPCYFRTGTPNECG